MSSHRLREFATTGELAKAAADEFCRAAQSAISARGRFVAVVPGGSTPRRVFSMLTTPEYRASIDWARVHLVPSDERLVSSADPDSNTRMIREELFGGLALGTDAYNFYPPVFEAAKTPEEMACRWEERLRELFGDRSAHKPPVFDLALLGMGTDGHTASLFAGDEALAEEKRWCVAIEPRGNPAVARVTLTLPVLSHARSVSFIATGDEKASVIKRIVAVGEPISEYPASQLANGREINWLVA